MAGGRQEAACCLAYGRYRSVVARLFSKIEDIQPRPAECYLLLYNFDPSACVLGICFMYRYQVIVHLLAVRGLEGCQILPELCEVVDPKENEVLCNLLHLQVVQRTQGTIRSLG
jgi:hypothetical protein